MAALVPLPWVNLTRYHGMFASHHSLRGDIVESKDDKEQNSSQVEDIKSAIEKRASMTWAQRLKRVFEIDTKLCVFCGGAVKILACIEDQAVINKMLIDLQLIPQSNQVSLPINHAPPTWPCN